MPNRQIKFIWDFFGEDAYETAVHHAKHLNTFFSLNQVECGNIDAVKISDMKSLAFVVADESRVELIKNSLKPHRATIEN